MRQIIKRHLQLEHIYRQPSTSSSRFKSIQHQVIHDLSLLPALKKDISQSRVRKKQSLHSMESVSNRNSNLKDLHSRFISSLDLKSKSKQNQQPKKPFNLLKKKQILLRSQQKKKSQLSIIPANQIFMKESKKNSRQPIIHSLRDRNDNQRFQRRIKTDNKHEPQIFIDQPLKQLLETLKKAKNNKKRSMLLKIDCWKNNNISPTIGNKKEKKTINRTQKWKRSEKIDILQEQICLKFSLNEKKMKKILQKKDKQEEYLDFCPWNQNGNKWDLINEEQIYMVSRYNQKGK